MTKIHAIERNKDNPLYKKHLTLYMDDNANSDISNKEDISNKVTSISSSSTDTQYPSAKCVYDIVGDIATLINAL